MSQAILLISSQVQKKRRIKSSHLDLVNKHLQVTLLGTTTSSSSALKSAFTFLHQILCMSSTRLQISCFILDTNTHIHTRYISVCLKIDSKKQKQQKETHTKKYSQRDQLHSNRMKNLNYSCIYLTHKLSWNTEFTPKNPLCLLVWNIFHSPLMFLSSFRVLRVIPQLLYSTL